MSENPFGDNDYTNPFGDATTNPYKASASTPMAATVNARSRLLPPAIILIVLSVMTIFATLLQIPRIMADAGEHGGVSYVVGSFLPAILNVIVICGAIQMARLKSYSSAMTAAILSVIPICSPCFFLGIPFGIWAIILLRNPAIKAQFR